MGQAASRQEAFWEACGFGHTEKVKKFLQDGDIDVNWVSYTHDCCPIHVASQGKPEIVRMLLEANCKVNVQDVRGNSPLHHAAMKGHSDIVQTLIDAGSEVNTQDKNGWTSLHCAAYWSRLETVKVLLKNGADVNIQNKDERTALHETARSQEINDFQLGEIAHCLIEAGSDVDAKSSDLGEADFTALMFAAYHNHPEVASALIDAHCDIDAYGTNKWTALHWACDRDNEEMIFLLLRSGIDPTVKSWRNELASDRCQSKEMKEVISEAVSLFEELTLLDRKAAVTQSGNEDSSAQNKKKGQNDVLDNSMVDAVSDNPKAGKQYEHNELKFITTNSDSRKNEVKLMTTPTRSNSTPKVDIDNDVSSSITRYSCEKNVADKATDLAADKSDPVKESYRLSSITANPERNEADRTTSLTVDNSDPVKERDQLSSTLTSSKMNEADKNISTSNDEVIIPEKDSIEIG